MNFCFKKNIFDKRKFDRIKISRHYYPSNLSFYIYRKQKISYICIYTCILLYKKYTFRKKNNVRVSPEMPNCEILFCYLFPDINSVGGFLDKNIKFSFNKHVK